jgi:hypothetical protein
MIKLRYTLFLTGLLLGNFNQPLMAKQSWELIAKDFQGEHYIDWKQLKYEERYHTATFKLLTNEYIPNTNRPANTSFITDYIIYCFPQPRVFNRYKILTFGKPWAKGKLLESFNVNISSLNIDEGKEVEISELVCKEKRFM